MTIYTTLNKIRECNPCKEGWKKLLKHLKKIESDDDPIDFSTIFKSNGLDDALWCTRSAPEHGKTWRLFAVWCARRVQHLMKDPRSVSALDVAERFANGEATDGELAAVSEAAWSVTWDTEDCIRVAREEAKSDAYAEKVASARAAAAWSAAKEVAVGSVASARAAADKAAWAVAKASEAKGAAKEEAEKALWAAEKKAQTERFLEVVR